MMSEIADGIGAAPQNPRWADAKHTQIEAEWNGETILINALPGIIRFDQITEAGFAIGDYVQPDIDAGNEPPKLIASALNIIVSGNEIVSVEGIYGLAGAIYLDVGQYMLLFMEPQLDTEFFAVIGGGAPCMSTVEKGLDYLIIQAASAPGGDLVDATQFNVQIFRV
jgi:hypothetical protein